MKKKKREKGFRWVRVRNKTELNAKHKFEVINTLAIPIVTYTFNVINWSLEDYIEEKDSGSYYA